MTTPLKKFITSSRGRHAQTVLRLLRAVANEWRTVNEIRKAVGMDPGLLRGWLGALVEARALRMRNRPHEVQENGDKPSGPEPREYKLSSKWSDLR